MFFQISKNHNSVNFCRRQKSYLKKWFGVSFSIEKKIKKGGYKIEGLDLEKFRCFFKFQKIITRSIFVLDKKVTWKKCSEYHFLLKKNLKTQKSKKNLDFNFKKS